MPVSLERAREFILRNARTLERRRFEHHFEGASADGLLAALGAYRNPDGGFGHALEADLRTSASQPICCEVAIAVMHEVGAEGHPWALEACDFLASVADPDGRVHPILASALKAPRADHWELGSWAPNTPNPTAGIAGVLHALEIQHPWLDRATAWLWGRIDGPQIDDVHELLGVTAFLAHVPDRVRADAALADVMAQIPQAGHFLSEPSDSYGLSALTFAPTPDAPTLAHLDAAQIESHSMRSSRSSKMTVGGLSASPRLVR